MWPLGLTSYTGAVVPEQVKCTFWEGKESSQAIAREKEGKGREEVGVEEVVTFGKGGGFWGRASSQVIESGRSKERRKEGRRLGEERFAFFLLPFCARRWWIDEHWEE